MINKLSLSTTVEKKDNATPSFTGESAKYMMKIYKKYGMQRATDIITDNHKKIDLNRDNILDTDELGLLFSSLNKKNKVNEEKLQEKIKEYRQRNIITISSPLGENGRRDIVQFQGFTDINEYENNKLRRIIGVSEDSISITQYNSDGTSATNTLPKTPENIKKYLNGIDLA